MAWKTKETLKNFRLLGIVDRKKSEQRMQNPMERTMLDTWKNSWVTKQKLLTPTNGKEPKKHLPGIIGDPQKATSILERWSCLVGDSISINSFCRQINT